MPIDATRIKATTISSEASTQGKMRVLGVPKNDLTALSNIVKRKTIHATRAMMAMGAITVVPPCQRGQEHCLLLLLQLIAAVRKRPLVVVTTEVPR